MKDPKIQKLVDEFYGQVDALNSTWIKLTQSGVFVSASVEGEFQQNATRQLVVSKIDETVSYGKESKRIK